MFQDRHNDLKAMKNRRKQKWGVGSVFSIEQTDGHVSLGQVVDLMFPNAPTCIFYDIRYPVGNLPEKIKLAEDKIIAALSTTREQLDRGDWQVLDCQPPALKQEFWPNEQFRELRWVGAKTHGSGIVTDFLEAFYGLFPWDHYLDPDYFDKLLFSKAKKPARLIFKKQTVRDQPMR